MAMTVTELNELAQKRAGLVGKARELNDLALKEKRDLSGDESHQYDSLLTEARALKAQIDREMELQSQEADLASARPTKAGGKDDPGNRSGGESVEYRGANIADGVKMPSAPRRASKEYQESFRQFLLNEQRTVNTLDNDVDAEGGYLHAPVQFVARLLKTLDNEVFVRQYAQVVPVTTSDSIGFPQLTTDFADAAWTAEVANVGSPDTSAVLGLRQFTPQQLSKEIDVSMKLLRTAALDPSALVADRLAYRFAITEEKAYMTGNGTGQPLGIFATSGTGAIPTSRDVASEVAGGTTFTADTLRGARFAMLPQYRKGARWLMHSDALKQVAKFKETTTGAYLWHPSLLAGAPDVIDGFPVDESQYCPNTFTAGLYFGALVNWSRGYLIADLVDLTVQRLNELLARTSQVGFIGRKMTDGGPVDPQAFVRVKMAAA